MLEMAPHLLTDRVFRPGTTGWSASDLDDPEIERQWLAGRYEIVEGVLTVMPPAYFSGGHATFNLLALLKDYLKEHGIKGKISTEVDLIIDEDRVLRADAAMMLPQDERRQRQAAKAAGKPDPRRVRILVPPTLVIESTSPGHESHDRRTKKRWYAEFGVPNYWILDAFAQTLECLRLDQGRYVRDARGKALRTVKPRAFEGLEIPLARVWESP